MSAPTIVKQTKDYMLVKIPLPKGGDFEFETGRAKKNGSMGKAEKQLWKHIHEAELDVKRGRVITAESIDEAIKRYDKRQWD